MSRLRAEALTRVFRSGPKRLEVLRGVSLTIESGEWVAILGRSGSGKSTLLHLLGGLDRPNGGSVHFDEQDIRRIGINRYRNQHVGFVFQAYHLLAELSAIENVLLAAMIGPTPAGWGPRRGEARAEAVRLLELMGLGDRIDHRVERLSGGERQRVAIARALINRPALLLADEPTGNLDAQTSGEILDLLRKLHGEGQTIVLVTHDLGVAEAADRRLTLEAGNLVGNHE
ncbi:ABC transporter ATP-binding protein [Mucisphaera calidilacus]|uniref:P-loop containing nucleoside triphosphate hydrolase n=1 Tax=Mucisphaera calidilacus TaxID=2527982 RepID=A0A518BZM0_9BACT|nr:ABC transporter ATP-binding protein [Mucisphaera calidilacus]QDU72414.1 P-loop containing nucleoside triphosphate hydrolase [Mucisphaera calidilacus]